MEQHHLQSFASLFHAAGSGYLTKAEFLVSNFFFQKQIYKIKFYGKPKLFPCDIHSLLNYLLHQFN